MQRGATPRHGNEHKPTAEQRRTVEAMAGYGIPEADVARVVGIAPMTLRKHYGDELDLGRVKANAKVAQSLFQIATSPEAKGAVPAAIFWLKSRAGWSEYAPAPVQRPAAEPKLGKKEQADLAAETAAEGTEWGNLLH